MRISSLSSSRRLLSQPALRQSNVYFSVIPVFRQPGAHYATTPTSSWTDESRVWEKDPGRTKASEEHANANRKPRDATEELIAEHRSIEDLIKRAMSEVAAGSKRTGKDTIIEDQVASFSTGFLDQEFPPRVEKNIEGVQQAGSQQAPMKSVESTIPELINRLQSYCAVETMHLYPLVRDKVPAGGYLHDKSLAEQAEVKNTLNRVAEYWNSHKQDYSGFPRDQLSHLLHTFKDHARGLETDVFPKLKASLSYSDLASLAEKIERARRVDQAAESGFPRSSMDQDISPRAFQQSATNMNAM